MYVPLVALKAFFKSHYRARLNDDSSTAWVCAKISILVPDDLITTNSQSLLFRNIVQTHVSRVIWNNISAGLCSTPALASIALAVRQNWNWIWIFCYRFHRQCGKCICSMPVFRISCDSQQRYRREKSRVEKLIYYSPKTTHGKGVKAGDESRVKMEGEMLPFKEARQKNPRVNRAERAVCVPHEVTLAKCFDVPQSRILNKAETENVGAEKLFSSSSALLRNRRQRLSLDCTFTKLIFLSHFFGSGLLFSEN